jgi:hypothetical protein
VNSALLRFSLPILFIFNPAHASNSAKGESIIGMGKTTLFRLRIAVELVLAAVFLYSGVNEFYAPRFALPTYIYIGSAVLGVLIGVVFIIDSVRITRRLRVP